jgi:hypothetical protein
MPEFPEVEMMVARLRERAINGEITAVRVGRNPNGRYGGASALVGQTLYTVARPVLNKIFERWPTALNLFNTPNDSVREQLVDLLYPLGFQNRRAERIVRMTEELVEELWRVNGDETQVRVEDLYGVGKYAADSYNIFVKAIFIEEVEDKELRNYVLWAKEQHGRQV